MDCVRFIGGLCGRSWRAVLYLTYDITYIISEAERSTNREYKPGIATESWRES